MDAPPPRGTAHCSVKGREPGMYQLIKGTLAYTDPKGFVNGILEGLARSNNSY